MRTSQYFLPTQRDTPADAELISHQLMLRAGLIRKLSSGLYTWLPLGLKVLNKVKEIVCEEMNKIGALEMLMPAVQPAELWQQSQRWEKYGNELLKIKDRHERDFCFGPTHEEVVTFTMCGELQSYKQLPLTVYQVQTKFRDEIRPRFGVMRAREFLMKDAYSFHIDLPSLQKTYADMYQAYSAIFTRLGLKFRAVIADTGSIGGSQSHEFHVLAEAGEDVIAFCPQSDYAANTEKAQALTPSESNETLLPLQLKETPESKTIAQVCQALTCQPTQTVKAILVKGSEHPVVLLLLRGDHELNAIKAANLPEIANPLTLASDAEITTAFACEPGFIGVININPTIPVIVDREAAALKNFVCGANQPGKHYINANWNRDAKLGQIADLRTVVSGDKSPDGKGILALARGIEVGHIFQLGTKYSEALNLKVLDEHGKATTVMMGCYGIGVSRIVAAAIEQNHDENGIVWPKAMAPFQVAIIPIGYGRSELVTQKADELYASLIALGIDVLFDDRKERPGVMFADMDLIGIPLRLVLSDKTLAENKVEVKQRQSTQSEFVRLEDISHLLT